MKPKKAHPIQWASTRQILEVIEGPVLDLMVAADMPMNDALALYRDHQRELNADMLINAIDRLTTAVERLER